MTKIEIVDLPPNPMGKDINDRRGEPEEVLSDIEAARSKAEGVIHVVDSASRYGPDEDIIWKVPDDLYSMTEVPLPGFLPEVFPKVISALALAVHASTGVDPACSAISSLPLAACESPK